jgi:hypothetical protein
MHTKFHTDWFRHARLDGRGFTDTQTAWRYHKHISFFFQIKEIWLKCCFFRWLLELGALFFIFSLPCAFTLTKWQEETSPYTSVPQNLSYNDPIRHTIKVPKIIRARKIKTVTGSILCSVHVSYQETGWTRDILMGKGAGRPDFDSQ